MNNTRSSFLASRANMSPCWYLVLTALLLGLSAETARAQIEIERADGTVEVLESEAMQATAEEEEEAAPSDEKSAASSAATSPEAQADQEEKPAESSAADSENSASEGTATSQAEGEDGSDSPAEPSSEGESSDDALDKKYLNPDGEPIQRDTTPPASDPAELNARPDDQGRVQFNFRGQSWRSVLDWLAEISHTSLDWQELPGDYLNLTTQRPYTVDEVRDLINQRLLTRGYTLLRQTEGMVVSKVDALDPGRVPRVHPEDLRYRDSHEFVKVSFTLSWLIAGEAVEELKPLLSPHGKMTALTTSNRLEVMDVVVNLQDLHQMLREEQSPESRATKVHEFFLRHIRAEDLKPQLETLIGKSSEGGSRGGASREMQEIQKMMKKMAESRGGRGGSDGGAGGGSVAEMEVQIVINSRQNSIVVHAPPTKLAVISEAVKMFDVPSEATLGRVNTSSEVKVYRLTQLDPAITVRMLQEAGDLSAATQLVADEKNKAIIAYAPQRDQAMIDQLISALDGSGRKFEMIRLRRLKADYVASSIRFMLDVEEEDESSRRWRYYRGDTDSEDKFRVDADPAGNRLLLWANENELESVQGLLAKLGETPAGSAEQVHSVRTIDLGSADKADELLRKLEEVWPTVSPAPLEIQSSEEREPGQDRRPAQDATTHHGGQSTTDRIAMITESPGDQRAELVEAAASTEVAVGPQPPRVVHIDLAERGSRVDGTLDDSVAEVSLVSEETPSNESPSSEGGAAPTEEADETEDEGQDKPNDQDTTAAGDESSGDQPAGKLEGMSQEELLRRYFSEMKGEGKDSGESSTSAPLTLKRDASGNLVASSDNPQLIGLLEDLLSEMTPPEKDWKIFQMEYATSFWVQSNLEEFFSNQQTTRTPSPYFTGQADVASEERELRFISDSDTNTILVQNASADQLNTIEELIELYDKPEPVRESRTRINQQYQVKHSKVDVIAETLKDVFRDLLSTNDRSMQAARQPNERTYITNIGGSTSSSNYKGKLSVGVDEISNTLVLSTEGQELMDLVLKTVEELDQAAQPTTAMRVIPITGGTDPEQLQELLMRVINEESNDRGRGRRRRR
ncbi:MAG: secretin N-terminal domain-containing protein [Pirellulaceae bacterium]